MSLTRISPEEIRLQRQIFENDPTNIWAYTNLVNFHLFIGGEATVAREIAQKALYCNPHNEKIYYDLAAIHQHDGETNAIEGMTHFVLFATFIMLSLLGL